ncbi:MULTISPECIES: hypothetical protein [Nostocales]|nr:hypothetical protein [Tolypothrix bouteillei]KAF3886531.1 hypothetical protein DA73_0400014365 [Tolypothrix bouteillei VB521301]
MASITISHLHPIDNERLFDELTAREMRTVVGGALVFKLNNVSPKQLEILKLFSVFNNPDRDPITITLNTLDHPGNSY